MEILVTLVPTPDFAYLKIDLEKDLKISKEEWSKMGKEGKNRRILEYSVSKVNPPEWKLDSYIE